jgi:ABC-2 type transport system ATP-binding protein
VNCLIVEIQNLTKIYPSKLPVTAVDGLDLELEQGEIFGLLGPNGAGKTTTISIATTRTLPTSGTIRINGIDVVQHPAHARRMIGVVPQFNTLDRSLTVYENLYFHCRYFGFSHSTAKSRSLDLLTQFMLTERKSVYPAQLSGGLAQRVQIARAIAHRPAVLFLDEPSAGLDPQSRMAMWSAVQELHKEGITVLLTTHYMEEADQLSDRLAILDHGRILALGSPEKLKSTFGAHTLFDLKLKSRASLDPLLASLRAHPGVTNAEATSDGLRVLAVSADGLLSDLVQAAAPYGLRDLQITEPSLETVFIQLTGRDLRE